MSAIFQYEPIEFLYDYEDLLQEGQMYKELVSSRKKKDKLNYDYEENNTKCKEDQNKTYTFNQIQQFGKLQYAKKDQKQNLKSKQNQVFKLNQNIQRQSQSDKFQQINFFTEQSFNCSLQIKNPDNDDQILNQNTEQKTDIYSNSSTQENKCKPQFKRETHKHILNINLNQKQELNNFDAKRSSLKNYYNKDLLKYIVPQILLFIKGHTQNSKIKYTGKDRQRAQKYEQKMKIQLSAQQCILAKRLQKIHRSPCLEQFRMFCGLKRRGEENDQFQMSDNTDNIRRLLVNNLRSFNFIKQMIKSNMSFNKKLSLIKKSSILERFPIEPYKIGNFDEN